MYKNTYHLLFKSWFDSRNLDMKEPITSGPLMGWDRLNSSQNRFIKGWGHPQVGKVIIHQLTDKNNNPLPSVHVKHHHPNGSQETISVHKDWGSAIDHAFNHLKKIKEGTFQPKSLKEGTDHMPTERIGKINTPKPYVTIHKSEDLIKSAHAYFKNIIRHRFPVGTTINGRKKIVENGKVHWRSMRSGVTTDSQGQAISVRQANADAQKAKQS